MRDGVARAHSCTVSLWGGCFAGCLPFTHPSKSDRDCLFFFEKMERRLLWSNPARRDALVSRMTTSDMAGLL